MQSRPVLTAQQIISDLYIQSPTDLDLEGIINLYDSFYQEKPMSGADGRIIFKDNKVIITINSEIKYPPKKRFVVAHELGHLLLHKNTIPVFNCDESAFMEWYISASFETQANEFAAEILMPQPLFIQEARRTRSFDFSLIKNLAAYFQTSITSTLIKFISYGTHPIAAVYSVAGKVKWQAFSNDFVFKRFKTQKGSPIPAETVAHDIIAGKATSFKKEPILATYWFNTFDSQRDIYLYEECFPIPSQNGLISLLWVCEDY
ncbi:ImmA/IrrE family metallo-endopeptidase [Arachidicoccus sp.]|uniref:ImmA/IrrE family metallo-endopeptidase n=1 Tax=Arachidicoccus sp. TaxID=1872624 RepID=UPI003D1D818D